MVKESEDAQWSGSLDEKQINYHLNQFNYPYQSTKKLLAFVESVVKEPQKNVIIDVATGSGANVYYINKKWNNFVVGVDINKTLIEFGREKLAGNANVFLVPIDFMNLKDIFEIEEIKDKFIAKKIGVTCFQTLSWLSEWRTCLKSIVSIDPEWICFSSLFYDGPLDCEIKVKDFTLNKDFYYNIYSIDRIKKYLEHKGYTVFVKPFEIDIDLPKPKDRALGTYTVNSENNKLQFSGPIYMPWYFILAKKGDKN